MKYDDSKKGLLQVLWIQIKKTKKALLKSADVYTKMKTELGKESAFVDGLYFSPHHTDKGFSDERPEYKCDCPLCQDRCRLMEGHLYEVYNNI